MVICQVCQLQEAEEKSEEPATTAQCELIHCTTSHQVPVKLRILLTLFTDYNLISHPDFEAKVVVQPTTTTKKPNSNNNSNSEPSSSHVSSRFDSLSIVNEYENDNVAASHMSFQSNLADNSSMFGGPSQNYSNLSAISMPHEPKRPTSITNSVNKSTGAIKKIPKRLDLMKDDKINNNNEENTFRHSGPYIPLSDCFSGSPVFYVSISNRLKLCNNLNSNVVSPICRKPMVTQKLHSTHSIRNSMIHRSRIRPTSDSISQTIRKTLCRVHPNEIMCLPALMHRIRIRL